MTSVHWDPDSGHVEWRFDSIILNVVGNPIPFFTIAGYEATDYDGFEDNVLYFYFQDGEGNPPGPGDHWTAAANAIVQTEQGGVLAGSGEMI